MIQRAIFGTALFIASASYAWAAIPDPSAPPAKPALNRASPMINDPATIIRGKPPVSHPAVLDQDTQAALPDDSNPALSRASPMISDDPIGKIIRGKPPASDATH